MNDARMIWDKYTQILNETRFSDKEYNNPESAWRLTKKEYIIASNKSGAFHPSSAYQPQTRVEITRENPPIKNTIRVYADDQRGDRFRRVTWTDSKKQKRSYGGLMDYQVGNPNDDIERAYQFILNNASGDIIDRKETIQYHFQNNQNYTKEKFPYKIETYNGVEYRYDKKDKILIAFVGELAVGMASDEWGAYLVEVDPNYRSKGIGSKLAHIYQSINNKDSGGYTQEGYNMAISLHKKAVKDAIKLGWYDKAIADGTMSKEKAEEILKEV